jgi:hypothetical protein
MTFRQLQKISSAHHYPLWLDKYFPKLARSVLRKIFSLVAILAFIFSFDSLPLYFGSADGLFFLFVDLYLVLFFLEAFYRSMKGQGVRTRIRDKLSTGGLEVDYALSSIIFETDEIDVTRALLETAIGQQVLLRAGVAESDCRDFIYGKRSPVLATSLHLEGETINLEEYVVAVYEADRSLQSFLASYGVSKEEFRGAARWVMSLAERSQREDRFWSRENLGKDSPQEEQSMVFLDLMEGIQLFPGVPQEMLVLVVPRHTPSLLSVAILQTQIKLSSQSLPQPPPPPPHSSVSLTPAPSP